MLQTTKSLLVAALFFPAFCAAETMWTCAQGDLRERLVAVEPWSDGVCQVSYNKDGIKKSLWTARHDQDYCVTKAAGFVNKLRSLGWVCTVEPAPDAGPAKEKAAEGGRIHPQLAGERVRHVTGNRFVA